MAGRQAYVVPETHVVPPAPLHRRGRGPTPDANRPAPPPWWAWGSQLGKSGSLIGPAPGGTVGSKPRHKGRDPHQRYGSMHGDLNITHGAGGLVTITHQPHGEDAGDAATPGAIDANEPNYGSGSISVDTDPMVSDTDVYVGMAHGIGTPGSFDATLAGGGMSPDSMQAGFAEYNDLDDTTDDTYNAYSTHADDPYSPPLREPTLRNYSAGFGFEHEMYSGFGPAAIIGCDMGCATDTELRG